MSVKSLNPVAEARRRSKAELNAAAEGEPAPKVEAAPVVAAEPPAAEPLPEAPPAEPAPAEPAAPKYVDGAHVMTSDPRRPAGMVTGESMTQRCYTITPDDGTAPYVSCESELAPFQAPMEEPPMTEETIATAALAESLGLASGATIGECTTAAKSLAASLKAETLQAKSAALSVHGLVGGKLGELVTASLTRNEGEGWLDAAARAKSEMPAAFKADEASASKVEPVAAAPVTEDKPQSAVVIDVVATETAPAEATKAEARPAPRAIPTGVSLSGAPTPKSSASTTAPRGLAVGVSLSS